MLLYIENLHCFRAAADYYEVVTTPIDLRKIQQKFKMEEYEDIDQLTTDVELLVSNAKLYYKVLMYYVYLFVVLCSIHKFSSHLD